MSKSIPQNLRVVYIITFIIELIFGLAGVFAARLVGNIAGHPVLEVDVNALMGAAALGLAVGSWQVLRGQSWETVRAVTLIHIVFELVGGIGGLIMYFVPSLYGTPNLSPVTLLIAIILTILGILKTLLYTSANTKLDAS